MNVLKFGGTSMADEHTWKQILDIISERGRSVTVVSATSKTTNALLDAATLAKAGKAEEAAKISRELEEKHIRILNNFIDQYGKGDTESLRNDGTACVQDKIKVLNHFLLGITTLGELSNRTLDAVSSLGEQLSSYLLPLCGKAMGLSTTFVDASSLLITDSTFGKAVPNMAKLKSNAEQHLLPLLSAGESVITGGFYGQNESGEITTLGRGGSDFSASLMAWAVEADVLEIWTDVSGMYTCDPRFVPDARNIPEITFKEAAELAYFGAKILHPATIQPAVERNIPVFIKNTFDPDHYGTRITSEAPGTRDIRAIAFKRDITIITITSSRMLMAYGFLAKVFATFEKYRLSVDLVTTSEVSVSMSVDSDRNLEEVLLELKAFGEVSVAQKQTLICLVGRDFLSKRGLANKVFGAVSEIPVRMISQGSSEINLSIVVDNEYALPAVQKLHDRFFSNQEEFA